MSCKVYIKPTPFQGAKSKAEQGNVKKGECCPTHPTVLKVNAPPNKHGGKKGFAR